MIIAVNILVSKVLRVGLLAHLEGWVLVSFRCHWLCWPLKLWNKYLRVFSRKNFPEFREFADLA